MKILDGEIRPGEGIGEYRLGMDLEQIVEVLNSEYVKEERGNDISVIIIKNAGFWFSAKEELFQIGVTNGFQGKYMGKIGIGNTLKDVKREFGEFYEEYDDYMIRGINGIAFEISDVEDIDDDTWDEMAAPIEWIFIYSAQ